MGAKGDKLREVAALADEEETLVEEQHGLVRYNSNYTCW